MIPLHTVRVAAALCREAYGQFPPEPFQGEAEMVSFGTDNVYVLDRFGKTFIIVLGTEFTLAEWWFNFKFLKKSHPSLGKVHRGFYKNVRELWDLVDDTGAFESTKQIVFIGHSRGAAIASIMALSYAFIHHKRPDVITFGSPRVGNSTWKKRFNASCNCTRVAMTHDPVTKVPKLYYYHVGEPMFLEGRDHGMTEYCRRLAI